MQSEQSLKTRVSDLWQLDAENVKEYQEELKALNRAYRTEDNKIKVEISALLGQWGPLALAIVRTKYGMNFVDSYGKVLDPNAIFFERGGIRVSFFLSDGKITEQLITWKELEEGI